MRLGGQQMRCAAAAVACRSAEKSSSLAGSFRPHRPLPPLGSSYRGWSDVFKDFLLREITEHARTPRAASFAIFAIERLQHVDRACSLGLAARDCGRDARGGELLDRHARAGLVTFSGLSWRSEKNL
jgi:hypothetical protein